MQKPSALTVCTTTLKESQEYFECEPVCFYVDIVDFSGLTRQLNKGEHNDPSLYWLKCVQI